MRSVIAICTLGVLGAGCSLAGLGEVEASPCWTPESGDSFAVANGRCRELSGGDGACSVWACRPEPSGGAAWFCGLGAPDGDDDGAVSNGMCEVGAHEVIDCDDANADRAEGMAERCDGVDNDCDGRIDEDVLTAAMPSMLLNVASEAEALAVHGQSGTVHGIFAQDRTLRHFQGSTVATDGVNVRADGALAIAAIDDDEAVAVFDASGCRRWGLEHLDGTSRESIVDAAGGIADEGGAVCGDEDRSFAGRAPAVATAGSEALVVWIESAEAVCGMGADVPLLGSAFQVADRDVRGEAARRLAVARPSVEPALAGVALQSGEGYLLAYATAAGLRVKVLEAGTLDTLDEAGVDLDDSVGPVRLALGATNGDLLRFAVAYELECGSRARLWVQRFDLHLGSHEVAVVGEPTSVAEGRDQTNAAMVFGEAPKGILVSWLEGTERVRRARLLGEDEGVAGAPFAVFGEGAFGAVPTLGKAAVLRQRSEGGMTLTAYVEAGSDRGFYEVGLRCSEN